MDGPCLPWMDPFAGHGVLYEQGSAISLYEDWNQLAAQILRGHDGWEEVGALLQSPGAGSPMTSPRVGGSPRSGASSPFSGAIGSPQTRSPHSANRSPRPAWTPGGARPLGPSNSPQRGPMSAYDGRPLMFHSAYSRSDVPASVWNPPANSRLGQRPASQAQGVPQQAKHTAPRAPGTVGMSGHQPGTQRMPPGMSSPRQALQRPSPGRPGQAMGYPSSISNQPQGNPYLSVPHRQQPQERSHSPSAKVRLADDTDLDGADMNGSFSVITARLRAGRNPRAERVGDRQPGNRRQAAPLSLSKSPGR